MTPTPDLMERMLVELTAQRLITRAIIGHLMSCSDRPIPVVIRAFKEAVAKTSPDHVVLPDVDRALQEKASALAIARADALLAGIGPLVAPLRAAPAKKTANMI